MLFLFIFLTLYFSIGVTAMGVFVFYTVLFGPMWLKDKRINLKTYLLASFALLFLGSTGSALFVYYDEIMGYLN